MISSMLHTAQTVLYGLGMIALGFWFGASFTGRLAYTPDVTRAPDGEIVAVAEPPAWVGTIETANTAVLAIFGVCTIGVLACDYLADE